MTLEHRDAKPPAEEAVNIARPRGGRKVGASPLADLYARIDAELIAAPEQGGPLPSHDELCEMWWHFQESVDIPEFRAIVGRHHTRAQSVVRARCFEVILEKPPEGGSYGFVVHKLEAHENILLVDEVKLGGVLDIWNRQMLRSGKRRSRVQPLAVIVAVNGISDHHSLMTHELMEPEVTLQIVNPPTVADVVRIYDLLKEGGAHPAPFWELQECGENSVLSVELAQMLDQARQGISPLTSAPSSARPPRIDTPIQVRSAMDKVPRADPLLLTPSLPPARQQLPEFSGAGSVEREGGWQEKERNCIGARQMEECLQPMGPPVTCGGGEGVPGGWRRNFF